jgi:tryptophan synthase alpha chain
MSRLSETLFKLKSERKKSLVAFLVAGDPNLDQSLDLMHVMAQSGADVIELGVPFPDPKAEGRVIQKAHERALQKNISLNSCFELVRRFREINFVTPIVLMGYTDSVEAFGFENFSENAANAGVDGVILVDLSLEKSKILRTRLDQLGIELVLLISPTTNEFNSKLICEASRGFVYCVSMEGTTGQKGIDVAGVQTRVELLRPITALPLLVGFGINSAKVAQEVGSVADGVIIGSALVDLIDKNSQAPVIMLDKISRFVCGVKVALGR